MSSVTESKATSDVGLQTAFKSHSSASLACPRSEHTDKGGGKKAWKCKRRKAPTGNSFPKPRPAVTRKASPVPFLPHENYSKRLLKLTPGEQMRGRGSPGRYDPVWTADPAGVTFTTPRSKVKQVFSFPSACFRDFQCEISSDTETGQQSSKPVSQLGQLPEYLTHLELAFLIFKVKIQYFSELLNAFM